MDNLNSTQRFSDRVTDYIKYRPDYPAALFAHLTKHCGLTANHIVADIGSGTGLLTKPFLDLGHQVYAVEPNPPMRAAAESILHAYPQFQSIDGQAEATTLANDSVDWIVAGQAFHWFDQAKTRLEFKRILKPGSHIVLIWNDRIDDNPFHQDYEEFLQAHCPDYKKVNHRRVSRGTLEQLFTPLTMEIAIFDHVQIFDFDGLKGRLLSCSYAPQSGAPNYDTMITALKRLFDRHRQDEQIVFPYQTKLFHFDE